jgi:hypothetical protein
MIKGTEKFTKGTCGLCGGHFEFPADRNGELAPCPHCGQEIVMEGPSVASPPPPLPPPPIPKERKKATSESKNPKLTSCPDCAKEVSRSAESCPHCGRRLKQPRSVFYYVCAVFGSLVALSILIAFGLAVLTGVFQGVNQAAKISQGEPNSKPRETIPLTAAEQQQAEEALSRLTTKRDDFRAITWYKRSEGSGLGKRVELYFGIPDQGAPTLRFRIQYTADDWLFVRSYLIKVGERTIPMIPRDVQTDHAGGTIWEWSDDPAGDFPDLIRALAECQTFQLRYKGSKYVHDEEFTNYTTDPLRDVIAAYRLKGGKWPL